MDASSHAAPQPDIDRSWCPYRLEHRRLNLARVSCHYDFHVREGTHDGNILYRLMCSAVLPNAYAAMGRYDLNIEVRITDGIANLLKRFFRSKHTVCRKNHRVPKACDSSRNTHGIGLRYADGKKTLRPPFLKLNTAG